MNFKKQVTLKELKDKTEKNIEKINLLMKTVAMNASEYIDNVILFANMEIEYANNNQIDFSQMSDFAQKLQRNPNIEITDGASLFQFLTGNSEEYNVPLILLSENEQNKIVEDEAEMPLLASDEQEEEKVLPKKKRSYQKRKSIVIDSFDIDGFEFEIKIKEPKKTKDKEIER